MELLQDKVEEVYHQMKKVSADVQQVKDKFDRRATEKSVSYIYFHNFFALRSPFTSIKFVNLYKENVVINHT